MKMNSEEYWAKRKAQNMWGYVESAEDTAEKISGIYLKASEYLQKESDKVFGKVKEKSGLSEKQAQKIYEAMKTDSIDELKKNLKKGIPTPEKEKLLELLDNSTYASRIRQLSKIQDNIDTMIQQMYKNEEEISTEHYKELAEESYNKGIYEAQSFSGYAFSFSAIDEKQIDKLLKSKWSGKNYSSSIWKNKDELAKRLKEELIIGLMTGKTNREMAKKIENEFAVAAYKARRIIRTESSYIANETEMMGYKECGIEKYKYIATLDMRTTEKCGKLDKKIFEVKKAQVGVNMPPIHPNCRCTTVSYIDGVTREGLKRRARDPETGKSELIDDMSYEEWKKKYVKKNVENKKKDDIIKNKGEAKDIFGIFSNDSKKNPKRYDYKDKERKTVEGEISKLNYEVAVIFDKNGRAVSCQTGNEDSVKFTKYQLKLMKGKEVTHNHPLSTPPSPEDLYVLKDNKAKSFRTCGKYGTYILEYNDTVEKLPDFEVFDADFESYSKKLSPKYSEMYKSGMNDNDALILLGEEVWEEIYKKYGVKPVFERKESQ